MAILFFPAAVYLRRKLLQVSYERACLGVFETSKFRIAFKKLLRTVSAEKVAISLAKFSSHVLCASISPKGETPEGGVKVHCTFDHIQLRWLE